MAKSNAAAMMMAITIIATCVAESVNVMVRGALIGVLGQGWYLRPDDVCCMVCVAWCVAPWVAARPLTW